MSPQEQRRQRPLQRLGRGSLGVRDRRCCLQTCLWVACYARGQPGSLDLRPSWPGLGLERKFALPFGLLFLYRLFMTKSIIRTPKRTRADQHQCDANSADVDCPRRSRRWIVGSDKQADRPSRSEAVRRLVELGLTVKTRGRQSSEDQKLRARAIAGKTIDRLSDETARADDQADRKRHLLKGPEEFREVRVDRPKRKT